jgi:hypothetical protein
MKKLSPEALEVLSIAAKMPRPNPAQFGIQSKGFLGERSEPKKMTKRQIAADAKWWKAWSAWENAVLNAAMSYALSQPRA